MGFRRRDRQLPHKLYHRSRGVRHALDVPPPACRPGHERGRQRLHPAHIRRDRRPDPPQLFAASDGVRPLVPAQPAGRAAHKDVLQLHTRRPTAIRGDCVRPRDARVAPIQGGRPSGRGKRQEGRQLRGALDRRCPGRRVQDMHRRYASAA